MDSSDTDIEEGNGPDLQDEEASQILERIKEKKEVISNLKNQPWPMKRKLEVLNEARQYVEKYEGKLMKKKSYTEASKQILRKMKKIFETLFSAMTLWNARIKKIESYFGSSVASYFLFLRWLVQLNVIMGLIAISFLVVPEILVGNHEASYKRLPESEIATAWDLNTVWSLGGYIKHSVLFYGYYTDQRIARGYRLPLAYFLVGIATFAYSFVSLLRKMAENARLAGVSTSEDDYVFSWRLFCSWDYTIGNSETAENKCAAIATAFREAIVEEQEKEKKLVKKQKKLRLFLRIFANALVLLLLSGSLCSIQFAVSRAQSFEKIDREFTFWEQNEVSIVVTLVTMVTPSLFELVASMENYHPRNALRLQLARILMLYLGNLYSLMIGLLGHVTDATSTNEVSINSTASSVSSEIPSTSGQKSECWETYIGQELLKLLLIDLLSSVITILIVDFIRALIVRYFNVCCCWDLENQFPEYGEFKIAENVLHLIYNQGITWVGSFFCPLLPLVNVIKLIAIMYVRSWSVVTCNVPHQRVFRASRSNNFYLAMLLFMLFLSLLPTVLVIVRYHPSNCGPFRSREWMHTILSETLEEDIPSWLQDGLRYAVTPVVILPLILLLLMMIYYLQAVARSSKETNTRLKLQLRYERKEGKKNIFKIGAGKKALKELSPSKEMINNSTFLNDEATKGQLKSNAKCSENFLQTHSETTKRDEESDASVCEKSVSTDKPCRSQKVITSDASTTERTPKRLYKNKRYCDVSTRSSNKTYEVNDITDDINNDITGDELKRNSFSYRQDTRCHPMKYPYYDSYWDRFHLEQPYLQRIPNVQYSSLGRDARRQRPSQCCKGFYEKSYSLSPHVCDTFSHRPHFPHSHMFKDSYLLVKAYNNEPAIASPCCQRSRLHRDSTSSTTSKHVISTRQRRKSKRKHRRTTSPDATSPCCSRDIGQYVMIERSPVGIDGGEHSSHDDKRRPKKSKKIMMKHVSTSHSSSSSSFNPEDSSDADSLSLDRYGGISVAEEHSMMKKEKIPSSPVLKKKRSDNSQDNSNHDDVKKDSRKIHDVIKKPEESQLLFYVSESKTSSAMMRSSLESVVSPLADEKNTEKKEN